MGTLHHLAAIPARPVPSVSDATASFTKAMYEAAIAEGERRVYARLGIPQPVPVQSRHLSVLGPVS